MTINFFSSKHSNETRTMPSKSDNKDMEGNETNEIIEETGSLLEKIDTCHSNPEKSSTI